MQFKCNNNFFYALDLPSQAAPTETTHPITTANATNEQTTDTTTSEGNALTKRILTTTTTTKKPPLESITTKANTKESQTSKLLLSFDLAFLNSG